MSDELARKIGYHFSNKSLFKNALTHRSSDLPNNERLEFLGDGLVNFIIAEALYQQFPYAEEGELSRFRASLINRETLGQLAREFNIGRYLILGQGELKSGGGERLSILSCTMEAIIGAIYLDGGFEVTRTAVMRWYHPLLQSMSSDTNHKDPKTQLQEYLQSISRALPVYTVKSTTGNAHQQTFIIECTIKNMPQKSIGKGSSRRRAEQDAAAKMLETIKNDAR